MNRRGILYSLILSFAFLVAPSPGVGQTPPSKDSQRDEIRAVFTRFVAAQNDHDAAKVESMLWNSPDFLWVSRGVQVRGSKQAISVFKTYYEGTWHLDPDMEKFSVTVIADGVAQLLVPVTFLRGAQGQPAQSAQFLISQTLVRGTNGWQITTILPIANTQLTTTPVK